jgi:hypothetical protein
MSPEKRESELKLGFLITVETLVLLMASSWEAEMLDTLFQGCPSFVHDKFLENQSFFQASLRRTKKNIIS